NLSELAKPLGQSYLGSVVENKIPCCSHGALSRWTASPARAALTERGGYIRFPEDRTDPDISVLQIRSRVSLQRQHLVPGKNVIGHSILGEVGVFDRANADRPRDVDLFCIG